MLASSELPIVFPEFEYKITQKDGKLFIYDVIAKKYRALTPEEWVRQHCLNYLTQHLNYPASNIQIERNHRIDQLNRRTDIQVYDSNGQVFMLVECKAPQVEITSITFQQASQYQKKNQAKYMVLTNGLQNYIYQIDSSKQETLQIAEFPSYYENN
ncbi:MAG: type I restriction enzyme HsdR N-terminal domain-containing protein [Aquirufa sp.]|jgi:hypothetical protein